MPIRALLAYHNWIIRAFRWDSTPLSAWRRENQILRVHWLKLLTNESYTSSSINVDLRQVLHILGIKAEVCRFCTNGFTKRNCKKNNDDFPELLLPHPSHKTSPYSCQKANTSPNSHCWLKEPVHKSHLIVNWIRVSLYVFS